MNPIARIGFLIKGDYSDTEMYDFMDIVYYNGASYVAKKPTIGNAPVRKNEYWQIFAEGGTLTGNSDISDTNVTFEQASNRVNISSKEKLSVIMGKIKKWFTDLKSVAFSGSYEDLSNKPDLKSVATTGNYSDLSNKPTIPTALKNPQALTFTGGVTGSYDGSAAKSVKVPSLTNNLLATAAGTALDAAQGKVLDGKIAQINSNLSKKQVDFTLASGAERVAGFSWIRNNIICLSVCLKINKNITANNNIITAMKVSGVPINVEWTYGICRQGDKTMSLVAMNSVVYVEESLLTANGEYIILSATCALQ